jgi:hypothetical protein
VRTAPEYESHPWPPCRDSTPLLQKTPTPDECYGNMTQHATDIDSPVLRGLCYGDGSNIDLADHDGAAPILGVIHVRNSAYNNYRLNLGTFPASDNQRWRFIVSWRTRNAGFTAFVDELEWEARSIGYEY